MHYDYYFGDYWHHIISLHLLLKRYQNKLSKLITIRAVSKRCSAKHYAFIVSVDIAQHGLLFGFSRVEQGVTIVTGKITIHITTLNMPGRASTHLPVTTLLLVL